MGTKNTRATSAIAPVNDALSYSYDDPMGSYYGMGDSLYSGGNTNDGGLFSSISNSDLIDGIGGIGQLGLGFMNYLENKKNSKMQRNALGQQIKQSQYAIDTDKQFKSGTRSAFA